MKSQEEGKYDREPGEHRIRLCFSGTVTGPNLRNSPKHFNREAELLFLGGLRILRSISKILIISVFVDLFLSTARVAGFLLEKYMNNLLQADICGDL